MNKKKERKIHNANDKVIYDTGLKRFRQKPRGPLYRIEARQCVSDSLPRCLDVWVNEPIKNLPKIVKDVMKKHPDIKPISFAIEIDYFPMPGCGRGRK